MAGVLYEFMVGLEEDFRKDVMIIILLRVWVSQMLDSLSPKSGLYICVLSSGGTVQYTAYVGRCWPLVEFRVQ